MPSPIEQAIRQICEEKGLAYEAVIDAIQSALAAAYRKDFGDKNMNVEAEFSPETGETRVFDVKTVVEDVDPEELERAELERKARIEALTERIREARARGEVISSVSIDEEGLPRFNPKTDIMISEARVLKMGAQVGDVLRTEMPMAGEFGRMAAMTAKQVITQKLREAEREIVFSEFKEHEGKVIVGTVQRREGRIVLVDIGRTTGVLRPEDQVSSERYNSGERIKVFVKQVSLTTRGPEILLSRASEELVRKLFEVEIPEVGEGTVKINAIAREAGSRSKVAVSSGDDAVDPIGACIGQRGTRIQTVISELGGEKVDIVEWNADPIRFIPHSLSPAKVKGVDLNEGSKTATVHVDADQLSLAIGRGGQNVRLASRLTGWKINIVEAGKPAPEVVAEAALETATVEPVVEPTDSPLPTTNS
ncbi:transcription termination/antitermination protein NusA [Patescibacteria group bacterium]|nr:MAG: transcription termination/antitermination protein NusA [Patescibacteria group bacterium]